ncbi:cap-specific mRNA (nucleoside-2'-O-)-methyltransferase 2-like [Musca autumnalis]|uniref:cap-specific mRNA (nucleoside-2'-O-)-methyltransferase 2-like n=1 Tax=Musca autumnalis TaxID=221902 RepID=UPI003CF976F7
MDINNETRLAPQEPPLRNDGGLVADVGPQSKSPSTEDSSNNHYPHPQRRYNIDSSLQDDVKEMFNKCFTYQKAKDGTWSLPSAAAGVDGAGVLFSEYYQLDSLQQLKIKLNDVKSKLNNYDTEEWALHTRKKDPAAEILWRLKSEIKAEFVTGGWSKLFECLNRFPLLVKGAHLNSLHLCEAPGSFIAALNHYMFTQYDKSEVKWQWLATTLNPYYEGNPVKKMIMDDRFMLYTLDNWLFHQDFTGNIISSENVEDMKQQCEQRLGEVHLITADGTIDCSEALDCQEEKTDLLYFAEIVTALEILAEGGCFVVKMLTLFEATSLCKLYLLNCVFKEVHIYKPCNSRHGNSEVYIVCIDYAKNNEDLKKILPELLEKLNGDNALLPLFPKASLPKTFVMQHEKMCRFFVNFQTRAIESNIHSFEIKDIMEANKANKTRAHALRGLMWDEYLKRYNVHKLPEEFKILYKNNATFVNGYIPIRHGSYSEREMQKGTTVEKQKLQLRKQLNDLYKSLRESWQSFDEEPADLDLDLKQPIPITLYRGKPLETLDSSLFANVHLFVMRGKLNEFQASDVLWPDNAQIIFPKENITLKYSEFMQTNFSQDQENFFKSLLENLLKHKPSVVKIQNMPILTHYAASILRYLSTA